MNFEQKTANTIESFQRTSRGGGCGIVGIGCGIVAAIFVTLCITTYFVTMHSSIPLAMIEAALESEGNVQVEGLKGSISSGFEMTSMKFDSDEIGPRIDSENGPENAPVKKRPQNELHDIRFSYNGFFNVLRSKRLIIKEASIGSATIYTSIEGDGEIPNAEYFNGEEIARGLTEAWQDMQDDFKDDDMGELKELRIDLLSVRNVALVDPESGTRLEFAKVEFRNYQWLKGQIASLGDLEIVSDQLTLTTARSTLFPDEPVSWNATGELKPAAIRSLKQAIPFKIDFAIPQNTAGNGKGNTKDQDNFRLRADLFNGQVQCEGLYGNEQKIRLDQFSFAPYFDLRSPLAPGNWNVVLTINQTGSNPGESDPNGSRSNDKKSSDHQIYQIQIEPGGGFQLGDTRFEIEPGQVTFGSDGTMEPSVITARGTLDDKSITASIVLTGFAPWHRLSLTSDEWKAEDIWSQLFYAKPYVALDGDEQQAVDSAIQAAKATAIPMVDDFEPVEF